MSPRLKQILIIIGFTVVTVSIAAALYIVFFRGAPGPAVVTAPEVTAPGELPTAATGAPGVSVPTTPAEEDLPSAGPTVTPTAVGELTETQQLTTSSVTAPTLNQAGDRINFYDEADGRFYKIDDNGEIERLSDQRFPNVEDVTWNENGSKAVMEFPDGANIVYDFDTANQVTLPTHWEDFEFSPLTDEIVAKSIALDPNNRALVITKADGSNTRAVASLGTNADKIQMSWSPNNQVIAFADTGVPTTGFGRKTIIPIGKNNENFKGLTIEGFDFQPAWNPTGDTLVYSAVGATNGYRPQLWVVDGRPNTIGNNRRSLGIQTWADKCTFSDSTTMYCAVPTALGANVGLQRALASNVPDNIFRVDLTRGTSELVAIPETPQTISQMQVSSDGSNLFYTDSSGTLQTIKLK